MLLLSKLHASFGMNNEDDGDQHDRRRAVDVSPERPRTAARLHRKVHHKVPTRTQVSTLPFTSPCPTVVVRHPIPGPTVYQLATSELSHLDSRRTSVPVTSGKKEILPIRDFLSSWYLF